jgi:hypothetical protein
MESITHEKIIKFFEPGKLAGREKIRLEDIASSNNIDERDCKIFEELMNWKERYRENYLLFPYDFFPRVSAREKRKRIVELKLDRKYTKSKKIAIEQSITPFKLIKNEITETRERYREERFPYSFKGISWRYRERNKLFYTIDLVEGYYLYFLGKDFIKCKKYFDKDSVIQRGEDFERLREEYNINKLKKDMEEIGGIISGEVISRSEKKLYKVHIWHIPLVDRKNRGFGVWLDLEKMCGCDVERWERTRYIGPREQIFCAHTIALYAYAYQKDQEEQKIFLNPFPMPTKELREIYKSLRKNCFIEFEKEGRLVKRPLNKIEIEIMLNRFIILGLVDLF